MWSAKAAQRVVRTVRGARYTTLIWGEGTQGQLGHYPFEKTKLNSSYVELLPRELVIGAEELLGESAPVFQKVACGTSHTLAIDSGGGVWAWGAANYGKLGHGDAVDVPFPRKVAALDGVVATSVACGDSHSCVVDDEGRLYTWGWNGSQISGFGLLGHGDKEKQVLTPKLVRSLEDSGARVASASCGECHTAIMTDDGEVLSCGSGEHGLNGNASSGDVLAPEPVSELDHEHVVQLEAGSAFTVARCKDGDVYLWGRNDQGQLGTGGGFAMDVYAMEDLPRLVEQNDGSPLKARHIAAGHSHVALATPENELYFWGMRAHLEPYKVAWEPPVPEADAAEVVAWGPPKVTHVYAGGGYTFARTDQGVVSFGQGSSKSLGHGDKKTAPIPKKVDALEAFDVADISAGYRHVAVLVV